jgi:protein subunit release factor A
MPFIKNQCMFVYADADLDSNQKMQEPLQKLYQYENKPDMREKIREYISELDTEIDRLKNLLKNTDSPYDLQIKGRLNAIIEVKNDLLGRMEEVV